MTAVRTGPVVVGGSRAGSGTCWLQIVAGRVCTSLTAGSCGTGFTCALAVAATIRVANRNAITRIRGVFESTWLPPENIHGRRPSHEFTGSETCKATMCLSRLCVGSPADLPAAAVDIVAEGGLCESVP